MQDIQSMRRLKTKSLGRDNPDWATYLWHGTAIITTTHPLL